MTIRGPIVASIDFGGTLDGRGIEPRATRWECYAREGFVFPEDKLLAAHIETRELLLKRSDRESWGILEATGHWYQEETRILGIESSHLDAWISKAAARKRSDLKQARSVLERLSARFHTATVTNNLGNLEVVLAEVSLLEFFDAIVDAAKCGFRKPDVRIFRECEKRFHGIRASHFYHLGDSIERDVLGALNAGWNAVWLHSVQPNKPLRSGVVQVASLDEYRHYLESIAEPGSHR